MGVKVVGHNQDRQLESNSLLYWNYKITKTSTQGLGSDTVTETSCFLACVHDMESGMFEPIKQQN